MNYKKILSLLLTVIFTCCLSYNNPLTALAEDGGSYCGYTVNSLPFTIYTPGTYCLTNNITVPSGSYGLILGTDGGVVIDMSGHTITCAGGPGSTTKGVSAYSRSNWAIKNGRIRNCFYAIDATSTSYNDVKNNALSASHNVLIENMNFEGNYFRSIRLDSIGSVVQNNRVSNTTGTTFYPNAYVMGIETYGASNLIDNNVVTNTNGMGTGEGVAISVSDYGYGTVIRNNTISNYSKTQTTDYGIWVGGDSKVQVYNNSLSNILHGIVMSSSVSGFYCGNKALNVDQAYQMPPTVIDEGNNIND